MRFKFVFFVFISSSLFTSCWKWEKPSNNNNYGTKVWGYKPIYESENLAKKIFYTAGPKPVRQPGNIYAFQAYIFQIDVGYGIHVIDNSVPAFAKRIGFIKVSGCSEISIKNNKLYTNSYDDFVVIDCSDLSNVHELSRLRSVFVEYRYQSPIAQPPAAGYFECPRYDSLVVGWKQDSVYQQCLKQ